MTEPLWEEIRRYVDFGPAEEARLPKLLPGLAPSFPVVVDEFYRRILDHSGASAAITGGHAQVLRLKHTLVDWLTHMFTGPYDLTYYEQRARIGRRHVQIALPQQYMFTAMNVIRLQLLDALGPTAGAEDVRTIHKILDLELAVMLHTYREDYLAQTQRHERLATFGQLVASIGHELRNPLGVMESSLYLLRGRVPPEERNTRHLDRIHDQIKLSNRIITDLLDMVRDRAPDRRPVRLQDLLPQAVDATPRLRASMLSVQLPAGLPPVLADPNQLRQVLVNLLSNAVDAAGDAGSVAVTAVVLPDGRVKLRVEDSGSGVDPALRARLFEPLVSNKARGVGLGLALCKKMLERNGGSIALGQDGTLGGAVFDVMLAAVEAPSAEIKQ